MAWTVLMERLRGDLTRIVSWATLLGYIGVAGVAAPMISLLPSGIVGLDLGGGTAAGEEIEDQRDPDTISCDPRLSGSGLGGDRDGIRALIARHLIPGGTR